MTSDRARPVWRLCVLFGAGVVGFVVWFGGVIPTRTCSGPLSPGVSPLLAFQLARTAADIEAVFGQAGDSCRDAMVAAMDRANVVDLLGFILTYGAFLACFFLALLRAGTGGAVRVGFAAVGAALAFDVLETATQLYISGALPGGTASLALLTIGSRGKFLALAGVGWCAGAAMIGRGRLVGRIAGVTCFIGGLLVLPGLVYAPARAGLSAGNALVWVVMLLYAAAAGLRR